MKKLIVVQTTAVLLAAASLTMGQITPERLPAGELASIAPGAPACSQKHDIVIGDIDNFVPGGPMAMPPMSAALTAFVAPFKTRRPFDDVKNGQVPVDQYFAASIPLGSCKVCGGVLEVKVRRNAGPAQPPTASNYGNDGLTVGVAPFAGANKFGSVSLWANDPLTVKTVTVALTAAQLNQVIFMGASALDVFVQDDTSVDYVKLTLTQ